MNITLNLPSNISLSRSQKVNNPQSLQPSFTRNNNSDSLIFSLAAKNSIEVDKILSGIEEFSKKDYLALSPSQISKIRESCSAKLVDYAAEDNLITGLAVKKMLDKQYGEGKYTFVSIGTSPAPIGRVMEFGGVETKYLPISRLNDFKNYQDVVGLQDFDRYEAFLNRQGISKEAVEKGDKTLVFYDYTYTAKSLNLFKDIIIKHMKLPENKLAFRSLNEDVKLLTKELSPYDDRSQKILNDESTDCRIIAMDYALYADDYDEGEIEDNYANYYTIYYLQGQNAEKYAGVGHLNCSEFRKIDYYEPPASKEAKKYNFLVIDGLKARGLLENEP